MHIIQTRLRFIIAQTTIPPIKGKILAIGKRMGINAGYVISTLASIRITGRTVNKKAVKNFTRKK